MVVEEIDHSGHLSNFYYTGKIKGKWNLVDVVKHESKIDNKVKNEEGCNHVEVTPKKKEPMLVIHMKTTTMLA